MREVRSRTLTQIVRTRVVRAGVVAVLGLAMAAPALPASAGVVTTTQPPGGGAALRTIYVSTTGSDANSGASAAAPVLTPAKAQQLVRAALPTANGPITVSLAAGDYYLTKTLAFGPLDSGMAGAPVTWRSASGATVTLNGGRAVSGDWTPESAGSPIMVTEIPAGLDFDGLTVDGQRQILARYPNFVPGASQANPLNGVTTIADLNKRSASWTDLAAADVRAIHCDNWGGVSYKVAGRTADPGGALLLNYVGDNNRSGDCSGAAYKSSQVMVENVRQELDAPGEWFYDSKSGQLSFYPPSGVDLAKASVQTAELNELIHVEGTSVEQPAHDLTFSGLHLANTHRSLFNSTYEPLAKGDWSVARTGALYEKNTKNITVSGSFFDQLGGNGVFMDGYNDGNLVSDNRFESDGATDVQVVGSPSAVQDYSDNYHNQVPISDAPAGPKTQDYPRNIDIKSNLMQNMGRFEKQAAGVNISMAKGVTVDGNSISGSPRACLNIEDGTWGGDLITNNDISDCVTETGDNGSINAWGRGRFWASKGNNSGISDADARTAVALDVLTPIVISHNRIWHSSDWAIDLDDGSSNYVIKDNLLLNAGIKLRDGYERVVDNNVLVNGLVFEQVSHGDAGDVITHNITLSGVAYSNTQNDPLVAKYSVDKNLFWNNAKPISINPVGKSDESFSTDGASLNAAQTWVKDGMDVNSKVSDPKFTAGNPFSNPSQTDFTVAPDSPALGLGFRNFSMTGFGVTGGPPPPPVIWPGTGGGPVGSPIMAQAEMLMGATATGISSTAVQSSVGLADNKGLYLPAVPAGSYAAVGGLQAGDVIRAVDGTEVTADRNTFWQVYNRLAAGDPLELTIWRAQSSATIHLTKTTSPEQLNNTSGVLYAGPGWDWKASARGGLGSYLDDLSATQTKGDAFALTFNGTGLDIITETNSDEGSMDLLIDGVAYRNVSLVTPTRQYQHTVVSIAGLAPGVHTLTGVNPSNDYLLVDAFLTHPAAADSVPPVVSASPAPGAPLGANGWYVGPVAVAVSAKDDQDPAPVVEAAIDGAAFGPAAGAVVLERDGRHTVAIRARDAAGNVSAITTTAVDIDTVPPTSAASFDMSGRSVTFRADDTTSGVARIEYQLPKGAWTTVSGVLTVGAAATVVSHRAVDLAGNVGAPKELSVPAAAVDPQPTAGSTPGPSATTPVSEPVTTPLTTVVAPAGPRRPTISLSSMSVAPGGQVTITVDGLDPGATHQVVLHSTPVVLAAFDAGTTGATTLTVTIPVGTASGAHTLSIVDPAGGAVAVADLVVTSPDPALAATGFPVSATAVVGLLIVLAGLALMFAMRRLPR